MDNIPNYKIIEPVDETINSIVYRGRKVDSKESVIIKVLKSQHPSLAEVAKFKQEYETIKKIDLDGVIKTYDLVEYQGGFALVLEDFKGISLKTLLKNNTFSIEEFLYIAIKLSETLGYLHKDNVIHMDIKPDNILVGSQNKDVKIADFGISSVLTHKNQEIYNPQVIEGTLKYLSPEQTGWMNRTIDYRTDLYSLGATLYEMLTGRVPFESRDPLEIIHAHVAKKPLAPEKLNPDIPSIISDIILKLLSKTSEERYQNSFGLMADFNECLRQLKDKDGIKPFELAQKDISIKFNIPQKLFGREKDIKILMDCFEEVSCGKREIVLVSGYPGIGKSAMINEIHKPIIAKRGYFISGKYDQYRSDVPYSAIIHAFQGLIRQILSESRGRVKIWKKSLLTALGTNGKVLTDIFPELELIIGKQPDLVKLGPEESQNRFKLVYKNFVQVFAKKEHPLVMVLDDVQWADSASLNIIKETVNNPDLKFLLMIYAFRDDDLHILHPLMNAVDTGKKAGVKIRQLSLLPLEITSISDFIINFLKCGKKRALPLAELLHQKTGGNPFFINQFVKTLYDSKLLKPNAKMGWQWDMKAIEQMHVTDNVVDFMADKICNLEENTREILKICSCIGNRFDLEMLSIILEESIETTLSYLTDAITQGFIGANKDIYVFQHDRIQEGAYSIIPEAQKEEYHYRIGKLMLGKYGDDNLIEKIFYIVNQLNQSIRLLTQKDEIYELARLNLIAGEKAKLSNAYSSAYTYFKIGLGLLENDSWRTHYDLTLNLHTNASDVAYLSGNFDEMENLVETVFRHAKKLHDRVAVYEVKIRAYVARNMPTEAIDTGLLGLKMLNIHLPPKPNKLNIAVGLVQLKLILIKKKTETLADLEQMVDPDKQAAMRILSSIGTPAYMTLPELFPLIVFKQIQLSVEYGNAPESVVAYAGYGIILCGVLGDIDGGNRFGRLAIKLGQIIRSNREIVMYNTFIRHWKEYLGDIPEKLLEAFQEELKVGDLEFAGLALYARCSYGFFAGNQLENLKREMFQYQKLLVQYKQEPSLRFLEMCLQVVVNLTGNEYGNARLIGSVFDEEEFIPEYLEANDQTALCNMNSMKLFLAYLYEDYALAVESSNIVEKNLDGIIGTYAIPVFYAYDSLVRLAEFPNVSAYKQRRYLRKVKKNQKKLKKWSKYAPMNHLHRYYLVEAELTKVLNRKPGTAEFYDHAIHLARKNGYIYEEALANERAAVFYMSKEKGRIARAYIEEARTCYLRWGAAAKVNHIDNKYPQLLSQPDNAPISYDISSTINKATIDLKALRKSLKTIAEENILSKMVEKIIRSAIEFAGAQKGLLLLGKESKNDPNKQYNLFIEAEGGEDIENLSILQSIPVESSDNLAQSIVNYVRRTKESVVIHNAEEHEERWPHLQSDTYIIKNQVKSILCIPIVVGSDETAKLIGLMYFENNLATHAFTDEKIEILEIICLSAAGQLELSRKAATDGLTGLYNHDYFQNMLQQEILMSLRQSRNLSIILIDIDHFKKFNDTWGHQVGDLVLQKVAGTIKNCCRKSDIVARYGGEEMVVILPETTMDDAMQLAEKTRETIEDLKIDHQDNALHVTISIGVSGFPIHAKEKNILIQKADEALYASKKNGRNQVSCAT